MVKFYQVVPVLLLFLFFPSLNNPQRAVINPETTVFMDTKTEEVTVEEVTPIEGTSNFTESEVRTFAHTIELASRGTTPQNYALANPGHITNFKKGEYAGNFNVSFYTPSVQECGSSRGITSSGKAVVPGYTAASTLPVGTILYLENWGVVEVMDTGGPSTIYGNRIDICVFDRDLALSLGRKDMRGWYCESVPEN